MSIVKPSKALAAAFWVIAVAALHPLPSSAATVDVVEVTGAIGVATGLQVEPALRRAAADQAELLVIRLDTPGGLLTSMRAIIQGIVASPVPVAVYVAPGGARAASAGTYITYAAHIAAMAPGTNIGAATPVNLIGPATPALPSRGDKNGDKPAADTSPPAKSPPPSTADDP